MPSNDKSNGLATVSLSPNLNIKLRFFDAIRAGGNTPLPAECLDQGGRRRLPGALVRIDASTVIKPAIRVGMFIIVSDPIISTAQIYLTIDIRVLTVVHIYALRIAQLRETREREPVPRRTT